MQSNNPTRSYLLNFSRKELCEFVEPLDLEHFRADQIFSGIYIHALEEMNQLTTLSKSLRAKLSELTVLRQFKSLKHNLFPER